MSSTGEGFFTKTCSGSEAGSYLRLIDLVYHPTLGLRVIKKEGAPAPHASSAAACHARMLEGVDLIRTSIYDKYSGL